MNDTAYLRTYFVEDNATIRDNLIATLEDLTPVTVLGYAETEQQGCAWLTGHAAARDGGAQNAGQTDLPSDPPADPPTHSPPVVNLAWDLAIVDLFLKQGSGLGVLRACHQRAPRQKVVVLSNYATPDVRARCLELGADAVFDKSHDIEALIEFCQSHAPSA